MSLISWANSKLKKMDLWDIKLIKWAAFLIGLPVGAYFASSILPYWWVFIIIALVAAVRPYSKVFSK